MNKLRKLKKANMKHMRVEVSNMEEQKGAKSRSREIPGPKAKKIVEEYEKYACPGISRHPPVVWEKAKGAIVQDIDGNEYIDFTSGIAVANAGHCPSRVVDAIKKQVERLLNCYDHPTVERARLQRTLAEITPTDKKSDSINKIQLATGGSEAIEFAIKVARRHTGKFEIITTHGGFHGRVSYQAMALTAYAKYRKELGVAIPGTLYTPYAYCYRCTFDRSYPDCDIICAKYLEHVLKYESTGNIAAFIVEPIQGAAGYIVPPDEYIVRTKDFCERHNILFIGDEIQSGFGRSGKLFAIEYTGVKPDIMVQGKGIGSGIPLTAIVGRESIMNSLNPGEHSSTYGGNPLSCAGALANIDTIIEDKLPENARELGNYILERFIEMKTRHTLIGDVRGRGLMIGIELVTDIKTKEPAIEEIQKIRQKIYKKGLLMVPAGLQGSVLRIAPPLVINKEQVDKALDIFDEALSEVEKEK